MKRKYIFEVETPPQHAICPPIRYFKSIEVVSFVKLNKEIELFFVSEWFIDIVGVKVTNVALVIHKVNLCSKNILSKRGQLLLELS